MPSTVDKLEKEALEWLESVTGEQFDQNKSVQETLKDGTILCKAFNACFSDMKVKYTCSAMPFKQMENIATFLHALSKLPNFRSFDLFSTVDLYEGKNMAQVVRCVLACKRFAEKEAISKGIEALKVTEDIKIDVVNETVIDVAEEADNEQKEAIDEDVNENEENDQDFMEVIEPEVEEHEEQEDEMELAEETESDNDNQMNETYFNAKETDALIKETADPEIILIDSPVYADDESEDQHQRQFDTEEFETFTQENPGTFEIQVSN